MGNAHKDDTTMKQKKNKMKQKIKQTSSIPKEVLDDERFKDVVNDPKFRPIPKSEGKVVIDQRFGKMFSDKRFKIKATMDKRGRPVATTTSEDLKKFYHLEEEQQSESSDSDDEASTSKGKKPKAKRAQESDDELLDLARGEGNVESSEEDSPDSSDEDEEEVRAAEDEQQIEWDELDKDAPRSEDISCRLAVCNMDWQNLKAQDLFVLVGSFAPQGGVVKSTAIYPSEFGKERMKIESEQGPLLKSKNDQALRKYEFDRLRYFYAVVECDSAATANAIYESCDGMEYQTSGTKLDLRFIPDDIEFDESEVTSRCDTMPENYEPIDFVNSALMLSKCESTWDTDDVRRKKALANVYGKSSKKKKNLAKKHDDVDQMAEHLKTYLASESDEEKDDGNKYRQLLIGDKNESDDDEDQGDKEITFNPELNAAVDKARKEKDDSERKKRTPFQEYLERRKQKKREKRTAERAKRKKETTFSDDDLPDDVDDSFFKQRVDSAESQDDDSDDDEAKRNQQQEELELLLMNENGDEKKHFSLKKILKHERAAGRKKTKRNIKTDEQQSGDDFKVDVNDRRFSAIYSDHRFNIDPTDNSFRKTKAMDEIVAEKAKRRRKNVR